MLLNYERKIMERSKKRKIIVLIVFLSLLLVIFASFLCYVVNKHSLHSNFLWEDNNVSSYIHRDYITKDGGAEAAEFFPSYEQIDHCNSVAFEMQGYDTILAPSFLLAYKSAFMLKLSFSPHQEAEYLTQKNMALEGANYQVAMLDPTVCILTDGHTSFPDQVAVIIYDDLSMQIIYLFYYDTLYNDWLEVDAGFFKHLPFELDMFFENNTSELD